MSCFRIAVLLSLALCFWACKEQGLKQIVPEPSSSTTPTPTPTPYPSGTHFVYTGNGTLNSVGVFRMDGTTGLLTAVHTISTGSGSQPRGIVIHPNGKFLYSCNYGNNSISEFSIDQSTGVLTLIGTIATLSQPIKAAIGTAGVFLHVLHDSGGGSSTFSINGTTGILTAGTTYSFGGETGVSLALSSDGSVAYASTNSYMHTQSVDANGAWSGIGSSFVDKLNDLKISPNGSFVVGTYALTHQLHVYPIGTNGTVGTPAISTTTSSIPSLDLAFSPNGQFLYSSNYFDNQIEAFSMDGSTGVLASVGTFAVASACQPEAVALDPDGGFLHTACSTNNGIIATFSVNPSTGTLALVGTGTLTNAGVRGMATLRTQPTVGVGP